MSGTDTLNFSPDALYMEEVYSELGGSIIVEHGGSNAAKTTRHDERKYQKYLDAVEQLASSCFPNCEVEANPAGVLKRITGSSKPRLGAFEVYVANEDGSNKQVVFSKLLTGKWPNLPKTGRYIMNVIEPDKAMEPVFDDDGTQVYPSGKMPTMPFIYTTSPHPAPPRVVSDRVWGYGNMNVTTHGLHKHHRLILPKGPDEPMMTYKEKVWRDYNTMQRTAKPRGPATPQTDPDAMYGMDENAAFDETAMSGLLNPDETAVLNEMLQPEGENGEASTSNGLLPPVESAEPKEESAPAEGAEGDAANDLPTVAGEAPAADEAPADGEEAQEEKPAEGEAEAAPAEGEAEAAPAEDAAPEAAAEEPKAEEEAPIRHAGQLRHLSYLH